ncbi:hypothetical protein [Ruminococcus albus]|uniref:hypothetical protein n=1 Tax=Ruminococcus albus TaxID=1264 RepID=UPI000464304D|nr:hypothetical protein [Ruminococcus albus]
MAIKASNDEDGKVNELVEMIDRLMAGGEGHINIDAEALLKAKREGQDEPEMTVQTFRSNDCGTGACCQPNEKAPDEDDEEL